MDAAEALKHQRRREHQSAYFQRLSSQIWVLVLYTHLDDLDNITEAERTKLRELFQRLAYERCYGKLISSFLRTRCWTLR